MNYHIIPNNDIKPHEKTSTCHCNPNVKTIEETGDLLIVHNSFDGREGVELANEILNPKTK